VRHKKGVCSCRTDLKMGQNISNMGPAVACTNFRLSFCSHKGHTSDVIRAMELAD
jgi:hypothetical protein